MPDCCVCQRPADEGRMLRRYKSTPAFICTSCDSVVREEVLKDIRSGLLKTDLVSRLEKAIDNIQPLGEEVNHET
jgi:hypothetical protein